MSNNFNSNMVSVVVSNSHYADVCSNVHFPDKVGFDLVFDAIKTGFHTTIDS